MAEKLSDKLKGLFKKADTSLGKGVDRLKSYPAKIKSLPKKGYDKVKVMQNVLAKSIVGKGAMTKKLDKPASKLSTAKRISKVLKEPGATNQLLGKAKKIGRVASRVALPVAAGFEAANLAYKVATLSPEKKAKIKKLKTQLSKKSTKQSHADLLKMSTGGDTMLKGNQVKLDKNKDGKISGEDFKMMKARYGKSVESSGSKANKIKLAKDDKRREKLKELRAKKVGPAEEARIMGNMKYMGGEAKGYGAARTQGEGLQDENLIPGKSLDYYKDIM